MDKVTFAGFTSPAIVVDRAAIAAKRAKDPHFQKMEKAEHIIEDIEGKIKKYAWGGTKKPEDTEITARKNIWSCRPPGKFALTFKNSRAKSQA